VTQEQGDQLLTALGTVTGQLAELKQQQADTNAYIGWLFVALCVLVFFVIVGAFWRRS